MIHQVLQKSIGPFVVLRALRVAKLSKRGITKIGKRVFTPTKHAEQAREFPFSKHKGFGETDSSAPALNLPAGNTHFRAEWDDDAVIMTVEKPLTLKYTDKKVFEEIQNQSLVEDSAEEMARDTFLQGL